MNAIPEFSLYKVQHRPLLLAPYYARTARMDQRPQLHEYRDTDYMALFAEDLTKNRLQASREQAWFQTNKLDGSSWPTLRQPVHQGYYLAACEITCDTKGRAPIEPSRIRESWLVVMPYGEGDSETGLEPRHSRLRMLATLARAREQGTAFPVRPMVVLDDQGRKHTILSGYLPVADIAYHKDDTPLQSQAQVDSGANRMAEKFAPFNYVASHDELLWNGTQVHSRLSALLQLLDENLGLGVAEGRLVDVAGLNGGAADVADLASWLDSVFFYRLPGDERTIQLRDEQQRFMVRHSQLLSTMLLSPPAALTQACRDAHNTLRQALITLAVPPLSPRQVTFTQIDDYSPERIGTYTQPWIGYLSSLAPWVDALRIELNRPANMLAGLSQLVIALSRFRETLLSCKAAAQALDAQFLPRHKFRDRSLLQWYAGQRKDQDLPLEKQLPAERRLIVPGSWVAEGPQLIRQRWQRLIALFAADWQSSKQASLLSRDDDQLYQVMMLALVVGDNGCEYLAHSSHSDPFTIASHYETRMMPTYPIKMPTLKDLKKAVRGPAMIMPPDLAAKINTLKFPDGEVKQSGDGGSLRWLYVFNIPIVTICAMILLMLMINILNFIFRWLPFAILRIPFPK